MEKYTADMHIHSNYSFDCKMPLENIVKIEIENGVKIIAVTDHIELNRESLITVINKLVKRNEEINSLEDKYAISIIKGIEVSEPHLHKEAMKFFKELDLIEYIIGSIHHLNGESFRFHKDSVNEYLRSILKMVEYGEFDTIAHLDYIKKYGTSLKLDEKLIDEILNIIIEKNLTLEVNTSGYRRCGSMFPSMDILTKYSEFGGEKITFGSDAHKENELYNGIPEAVNETKVLNLTPGIIKNGQFKSI